MTESLLNSKFYIPVILAWPWPPWFGYMAINLPWKLYLNQCQLCHWDFNTLRSDVAYMINSTIICAFGQWFLTCSVPNHCLKQCWLFYNWIHGDIFRRNLNWCKQTVLRVNELAHVCKMYPTRCAKWFLWNMSFESKSQSISCPGSRIWQMAEWVSQWVYKFELWKFYIYADNGWCGHDQELNSL